MANSPVIIIKKIKKVSHGGHHGGGWKVAYADFVTAMMAFFLLMWLLNATTEEQRKGISNYFGPPGDQIGAGGSGGILGGKSLETEGNFQDSRASSPMDSNHIKKESEEPSDDEDVGKTSGDKKGESKDKNLEAAQAQKVIEKFESEKFREAEQELRQAIQKMPDLKDLAQNLIIDQTPEGLRIQIVDQKRLSMFPSGSADMYPYTRKLLQYVEQIVEKLPNKISITGHTDDRPYSEGAKYTIAD
ncbi:MAG: flagellar motor protein MotB [Janthinobacterium lividum]